LISIHPQSGYSIITTFESGLYRWSPSPGSVYPILKRLEKQELLGSELEVVHETRPRKMYSLTPLGETVLDEWLRRPLSIHEVKAERDIVLRKFLFIEKRFTPQETMTWLDNYERETEACQMILEIPSDPELRNLATVHHELIAEALKMEMEMQRKWIQMARQRLAREAGKT
jgi:DNA-binding PadR family transcriptional regulator